MYHIKLLCKKKIPCRFLLSWRPVLHSHILQALFLNCGVKQNRRIFLTGHNVFFVFLIWPLNCVLFQSGVEKLFYKKISLGTIESTWCSRSSSKIKIKCALGLSKKLLNIQNTFMVFEARSIMNVQSVLWFCHSNKKPQVEAKIVVAMVTRASRQNNRNVLSVFWGSK